MKIEIIDSEQNSLSLWKYSEIEGKQINVFVGHVALSFALWNQYALQEDVSEYIRYNVGHCILASRGRKDWGSPVEPQTPEAFFVHQIDMLVSHC